MSGRYVLELATCAALVLSASSANGANKVYTFSGKFTATHGHLANVPIVGNTACTSLTIASGPGGAKVPAPLTPPTRTMMVPAAPFGCVAAVKGKLGKQIVTTGKGVGGGFFMPPSVFSAPLRKATTAVHVGPFPAVQLATSFRVAGPAATRTTAPMGTMANGLNTAAFHAFKALAYKTQTGRAGANFTWCPGQPACTKVTQGTRPLIVKYRAGPNKFGGTMALLRLSGPNTSSLGVELPGGRIAFAAITGVSSQPTGRGYAESLVKKWLAKQWAMYMVAYVSRPIVGKQQLVTMVTSPLSSVLLKQYRHGFPFTTGTVLVRGTGTVGGNPDIHTISAMGKDTISPMGARNLSLVAGAVTVIRSAYGDAVREPIIVQMALPEPGGAPQIATAVIALLAIAARRARRIR